MVTCCRKAVYRSLRSGLRLKALGIALTALAAVYFIGCQIVALRKSSRSSNIKDFFADKHLTSEGVFPLPQRREYPSKQKKDSVLPVRFFQRKPGVSAHHFQWLFNPHKICIPPTRHYTDSGGEEVFLLVAIASAVWEFERREVIRRTWASVQKPHEKNVKYVFFLGNDGNSAHRAQVKEEFTKYKDLVMEDFAETYKNLTLKTQGQLKWVTHFCPNARYVMHVDDDVFADVSGVVGHLLGQKRNRILHCGKVFKPTVRREGKWTMSKSDYPRSQYPLACVGWCFVMSQDVANDLYYMSLDTFLIHLEDVTFTGILRERIGDLQLAKMAGGETLCQHKGWPKDDEPTNDKLARAWQELQEKMSAS